MRQKLYLSFIDTSQQRVRTGLNIKNFSVNIFTLHFIITFQNEDDSDEDEEMPFNSFVEASYRNVNEQDNADADAIVMNDLFRCSICQEAFQSQINFFVHLQSHYNGQANSKGNKNYHVLLSTE